MRFLFLFRRLIVWTKLQVTKIINENVPILSFDCVGVFSFKFYGLICLKSINIWKHIFDAFLKIIMIDRVFNLFHQDQIFLQKEKPMASILIMCKNQSVKNFFKDFSNYLWVFVFKDMKGRIPKVVVLSSWNFFNRINIFVCALNLFMPRCFKICGLRFWF